MDAISREVAVLEFVLGVIKDLGVFEVTFVRKPSATEMKIVDLETIKITNINLERELLNAASVEELGAAKDRLREILTERFM